MQIVIDVDTDNPIHHAEGTDYFIPDLHAFISENLFKILKESCKVLPKGHGRLIDADALVSEIKDLKKSPWYKDNTNLAYSPRKEAVEIMEKLIVGGASTIIKADKENQND